MKNEKEFRSNGELRVINDDGTFEGYLTVWDTVDDYNSTFQRGSFKKTINERGSKVKIFYNHEHLVGSAVELREDDHGVFGSGKLNLNTEKAKEAYEFMRDGTLEGLSFGFRIIKETFSSGVRQIKEVQLFEFGPVVFPANDQALITGVRAENFKDSATAVQLEEEGYNLKYALSITLSDIWWSPDTTVDNAVGKLDQALSDFHAMYLDYANKYLDYFWKSKLYRTSPGANELEKRFVEFLSNEDTTIEKLASSSDFTLDELQELRMGNIINNVSKLDILSEDIVTSHRKQRNESVENLCLLLRDKLTDSEKSRISSLLLKPDTKYQSEPGMEEIRKMTDYFKNQ